MPKPFQDHFSGHAGDYASFRPSYPDALFDILFEACEAHERAWDCATGNGQAALALTRRFGEVVATDASQEQIAAATPVPGIHFAVRPADASGLGDGSVDLVTVAQALHWFDIDAFFSEARRVMRPGAVFAAWSYDSCELDDDLATVVAPLIADVEAYWPPERAIVARRYADIDFPFVMLDLPLLAMRQSWRVEQMLGYVRTWSAVRRYVAANKVDPVAGMEAALRAAWGTGQRTVTWPLTVKAGRR